MKRVISNHDRSCSICIRDDKVRTRAYKNFLIYITNRWGLEDATNETNNRFEALKKAVARYKKDEQLRLRDRVVKFKSNWIRPDWTDGISPVQLEIFQIAVQSDLKFSSCGLV